MAKILVAEDEANIRELFASVIEKMGHTVIRSPDGRLAWDILQSNPDIRLVLCDIAMPVLDGRELIRLVRGRPEFASLPIVAVSGVIRAREIANLLERGASCFLAKPVDLQELRELIGTYVA